MIQLQKMKPEVLINSSYLETYERELEALWWQLIQLNANFFVLEKIQSFPFDLFKPILTPFWQLIYTSLFETSLMIISRLVDPDKRTLTFQSFKDRVNKNMINKKYNLQLNNVIKRISFEIKILNIRKRVKEVRNKRLAHYDRKWIKKYMSKLPQKTLAFPSLKEIKDMRDTLNSIFNLFCFGHGKAILPVDYISKARYAYDIDNRSDIEILLDNIAKESPLLKMPEEQPNYWSEYRKTLSGKEINILNQYRKKFGLSKV